MLYAKKDWSMLRRIVFGDATGGSGEKTYTVTGNPVSFNTNLYKPLSQMLIPFSPVQDLHGYDNPWPSGGGKNKCPVLNSGTNHGMTLTVDQFGVCTLKGQSDGVGQVIGQVEFTLPAGSYIANGGQADYTLRVYNKTDASTLAIANSTTVNVPFTLASEKTIQVFIRADVTTAISSSGLKYYPMIRLSTESDATFAPYSNICPISGWTGVNVRHCGKNLFDGLMEEGQINPTTGENASASSKIRSKNFIPVKPNTIYTLSRSDTTSYVNFRLYSNNQIYLGTSESDYFTLISGSSKAQPMAAGVSSCTFSFSEAVGYLRFQDNIIDTTAKYQLELGDTASEYEPYITGKNLCFESSGNNKVIASVASGKTYTFSLKNTGNVGVNLKKNNSSGETVASSTYTTESLVSITFTADDDYSVYLNGYSSGGSFSSLCSDYQLELGSSATDYEPYTDGKYPVVFPGLGKNLLTAPGIEWKNNTGEKITNNDAVSSIDLIPVQPGDKFTYYKNMQLASGRNLVMRCYDANKTYLKNGTGMNADITGSSTATVPSDTYYVAFTQFGGNGVSGLEVQVEKGNTYTGYEAPTTTAYSGTLDVTTGELVVDCGIATENSFTAYAHKSNNNMTGYVSTPDSENIKGNAYDIAITNMVPVDSDAWNINHPCGQVGMNASTGKGRMRIYGTFESLAEFKTQFAGLQFIYELTTPLVFHLTPVEIQTLIGDNTVWSDTNGENTVKYLKKG